jgi:transcriptional regulator with XRE-family HTH domain
MNKLLLMKETMSPGVQLAYDNIGSWHDLREDLIAARVAKGWTQADLAAALGISQSAVSQFETLGGNPRLMTLMAYAQALNVRLQLGLSETEA